MQKTKLMLGVSLLVGLSSAAYADPTLVADPASNYTIHDYAVKKKRLAGLLLDVQIKDAQDKLSGTAPAAGKSNQVQMDTGALPPLSLKRGESAGPVALANDDMLLVATFGPMEDLKAELTFNGRSYVVKKGSTSVPGWRVAFVGTDRITLVGKKATKEIYLTAATSSQANPELGNARATVPGMPPVPTDFHPAAYR